MIADRQVWRPKMQFKSTVTLLLFLSLSLAAVFSTAMALAQTPVPAGLESKIDAFVKQYQPAENTGVAVGIVKSGKLIYFKGYGYRDRANKLPVTPGTLFAIGSNSKAFTSLAISILADAGKADLESPLKPQLVGFGMSDARIADQITPVDMLSHRTGLPRHDLLWYLTPFSRFELFRKLPYLALNPHPGLGFRQGFQYNNLMYMTIGVWIEALTRQTWESFVTHRILLPLQMSDTNFSISAMQSAAEFALPYRGPVAIPFHDLQAVGPAGSINSNMNDLTKWVSFHLRGGKTENGTALLSATQHERLFKKESDASSLLHGIESIGYGLGWFLSDISGHRVIWHGGNIDGFSSFISFVPDSDLAVVILTNETHGSVFEFPIILPATAAHPDIKLLPRMIYEELFIDSQTTDVRQSAMSAQARVPALRTSLAWPADFLPDTVIDVRAIERQLSARMTVKPPESKSKNKSDDYVGDFSERAYGDITVRNTSSGLMLDYYSNHFPLLDGASADAFKISVKLDEPATEIPVTFRRDSQGVVTGAAIPLEPEVSDIFFARSSH